MAGSDAVTIATHFLGSCECSNALQVLSRALGCCVFGLHFHREPITCAQANTRPSALTAPIWAAQRSNSSGLFASSGESQTQHCVLD
jgi:hypothetical protein